MTRHTYTHTPQPYALPVDEDDAPTYTDPEPEVCPWCLCYNNPTGTAGRMLHYHCRDCGTWYAAPNPELDA